MPKIKQLSSHEAQKIAAGEVVERPANIVKELVENSIDAGATRISIYIEDAGKQLIRVVDNGCGMDKSDAQICFDRHATSKITHVDELESITTFGFRGEALASIASVSHITLITKEEDSLEGVHITIDANTITNIAPVACTTGTDISVKNLFYNVPARKKFLKTTATEWRAIQLLFNAFCFDYPHIHFALYTENKQVNNCPSTQSLDNRAAQLWDAQLHKHLLTLHSSDSSCTINGVISDHQHYRYDRSSIYFFVNKRWIKNQQLASALIKGYANVIPEGRCPVAIINLTIPTAEVDINIHPRKEEVKFLHPRRIEQALQQAVKKALELNVSQHINKNITFRSSFAKASEDRACFTPQPKNFTPFNFNSFFAQQENQQIPLSSFDTLPSDFTKASSDRSAALKTNGEETNKIIEEDNPFPIQNNTSDQITSPSFPPFVLSAALGSVSKDQQQPLALQNDTSEKTPQHANHYRLIGQYNKTYLLIEKEDGLFLIDQHAAHERILYELFANRFNEVATTHLMFPQLITLSQHDITLITPHLEILTTNGILIEQCASDQLIVQALPAHLKEQSLSDLIKEMISWIIEYKTVDLEDLKKTIHKKLQAQMACKAAVKAGDELTQEKMHQLLIDLEKTANRFSCPHGRPTGWLLSLNEIEKKFKRKL
jgi:DNA mismatch repair protein MutL